MDREEALETLRRPANGADVGAPRKSRRWMWILLAIVVAAIVVALLLWWFLRPQAVAVETFTVPLPTTGSNGAVVSATGYVTADQRSTVSSKLTAMVEKVLVTEGQHVKKGELVAVLDDSLQRASVTQMQATLLADHARIAKAKAHLDQAKLKLKRRKQLAGKRLISQADLDQARAEAKSATADYKSATAQLAVDKARLNAAQTRLSYTRIYAPFSGIVTKVYAHPGEMISPAAVGGFTKTGICDLVNMGSLQVTVDVNEDYLKRIKKGMHVMVAPSSYSDVHLPGHLQEIVPIVNRAQATVEVHIAFDKLDPRILPGMQAQVFFYSAKGDGAQVNDTPAVRIPDRAVRHDEKGGFVYKVVDGRLKRQSVRVRSLPGGEDAVLSGLSGGERIVTGADAPLHSGMAVHIRKEEIEDIKR